MRIIDHKKIDLTNEEWTMYQEICKSYTQEPYRKGEDLFQDLFESNDDGIILFVKPPRTKFTSMEVFLFLVSVMNNQHIRIMENTIASLVRETKDNIAVIAESASQILTEAKQLVEKLKAVEDTKQS
jgi:hypothetical protein